MSDKQLVFENSVQKKMLLYADRESLKIILRNLMIMPSNSANKRKSGIYTRTTDKVIVIWCRGYRLGMSKQLT